MIPWLEVTSNVANASSVLLAARNSLHTWWTGIVGCVLFAILFYQTRLYADVALQGFFIATSIHGWRAWRGVDRGSSLSVTRASGRSLWTAIGVAVLVALAYGLMLWRFTDAFAPWVDSFVLTLSVVAQILLMRRQYETWWLWLAVDTLSVALFSFRGLWITAALCSVFWVNAWYGRRQWAKIVVNR